MYKASFFLAVSILLLLYIVNTIKLATNRKNLYFMLLFVLCGTPILYNYIGNYKSLEALSLPKIKGQVRENEKLRPLIASVERRTAKMGMLCDLEPSNVDNWWQYGQLLELQQRTSDALQIYTKAFDIHRTAIPILERIVLLSLKLNDGKTNSVVEKYSKFIFDLDPTNIVAKHANALSLYQVGEFHKASEQWESILVSIENDNSYSNVKNDIKGMIDLASKLDEEPNISLNFALGDISVDKHLFISLKQHDALASPPLLAYRSIIGDLPSNLRLSSLHAISPGFNWDDFKGNTLILEVFLTDKDIIDGSAKRILAKKIELVHSLGESSYLVDNVQLAPN